MAAPESLDELASSIRDVYATIERGRVDTERIGRRTLDQAIVVGHWLNKAQAQLEHGEWYPWIKSNCGGMSVETASLYKRFADHERKIRNESIDTINEARRAIAEMTFGVVIKDYENANAPEHTRKKCNEPGCDESIPDSKSYCDRHRGKHQMTSAVDISIVVCRDFYIGADHAEPFDPKYVISAFLRNILDLGTPDLFYDHCADDLVHHAVVKFKKAPKPKRSNADSTEQQQRYEEFVWKRDLADSGGDILAIAEHIFATAEKKFAIAREQNFRAEKRYWVGPTINYGERHFGVVYQGDGTFRVRR